MSIAAKLIKVAENEIALIEKGGQSYGEEFWGQMQNYGKAKTYADFAFAGSIWTDETFRPIYPFVCSKAYRLFERLAGNGMTKISVPVDITRCTRLHDGIYPYAYSLFANNTRLTDIAELIVSEDTLYSRCFYNCTALKNIKITGIIGKEGLSFSNSSKLTKESFESIVSALSDTTTDLTITFSAAAKAAAFTDEEWAQLIETKPNWTFSLV